MSPIWIPSPHDLSWNRAAIIAKALRAKGKSNPWIVAALTNSLAESGWRAVIGGDRDAQMQPQSFGPWQMKYQFYGEPILKALNVDIRSEVDLARHADALVWLIDEFETQAPGHSAVRPFAKVSAELAAATTFEEATRAFVVDFERASAAGALERRLAAAPPVDAMLPRLLAA